MRHGLTTKVADYVLPPLRLHVRLILRDGIGSQRSRMTARVFRWHASHPGFGSLFHQTKKDALAGVLFVWKGRVTSGLLGQLDLRQRDGLLAVLLRDDAFGFDLLGVSANRLVECL